MPINTFDCQLSRLSTNSSYYTRALGERILYSVYGLRTYSNVARLSMCCR